MRSILKSLAICAGTASAAWASQASAQVNNSQTDARDYEVLAYLPNNTLIPIAYARHVSTSDSASYSQDLAIFRTSYVLKFGNLAVVPFDMLLPAVDATVYVPTAMGGTATLHSSGLGDLTYLPTIGYVINEDEATHTHSVVAGTVYVSGPFGNYDSSHPVNIGDNRWRIQPQVAFGQRFAKAFTAELVGSMAFYTDNDKAFTGMAPATQHQDATVGFEGHVSADISPTFHADTSYYLAAAGAKSIAGTQTAPEQTTQTLRFSFGVHLEKSTLLLLQYSTDIEASGGGTISRFFGARLSHVIVL